MEIHAISSLPDFEEAHALINAMDGTPNSLTSSECPMLN